MVSTLFFKYNSHQMHSFRFYYNIFLDYIIDVSTLGGSSLKLVDKFSYQRSSVSSTETKLDGNYTRMLPAILNKSWRQRPTKPQLYSHLPPITKSIKVSLTRNAGHCWRSRDELISDVLPWTPSYGRRKTERPPRTYIQQLCQDTGCSPEDLRRSDER